jgi:hypothetical protein
MGSRAILTAALVAAMVVSGCATAPDMTPTRAVAKKDMAACSQVADRAVNDPARKNQQTAVVVGSAIGAGLIGLVVAAASTSNDDKVVEAKTRNHCLSRRGYKMVPKKVPKQG